jgi:hypothetical protein
VDYVEWVEKVLQATGRAHNADARNDRQPFLLLKTIAAELELEVPDFGTVPESAEKAILDALSDLERMGLVKQVEHPATFVITPEGKRVSRKGIYTLWEDIFTARDYLDDEHFSFLQTIVAMGQQECGAYVATRRLPLREVCASLGFDWGDRGHAPSLYKAFELARLQLVEDGGGRGNEWVGINYRGAVLATRQEQTEWQVLVRELLVEWENTNVEFKRELNLKSDKEKAEFVRDILGLATTRSRGRRFLVIGFGPKSHLFEVSADPKIDQDRLERILHAWTEPTPGIHYAAVPWETGAIGIIEVLRESEKIPYKVKGNLGHIREGEIYVRHGSQTEAPTPAELEDLLAEGELARVSY